MRIMGTGSRSMILHPERKEIYSALESKMLKLAGNSNFEYFITGMAEGWDEAIATAAMRNNLPYIAMIPNMGYGDYYWGRNSLLKRNRITKFNELLDGAQEVIYVCNSIYVNGVHSNFLRNQAMVDRCTHALVYDASSSGTRDAVRRLEAAKRPYKVYPF